MKHILPILLASALLSPTSASALTDAQKCSSFKWKVAGGHAECLLKEDAKAIKTGKEPDYSSCERKLTIKYTRAELKWACDVEGEIENVSNLLSTCTEGVRETTTSNALSVVGVSPGWTCTGPAPDNCEPICGDSLTVGPEFCDDGNTTGSDGCSADCLSGCGDGLFEPAEGEECDDGNSATDDGCTPDCIVESCGDGVRQASEACDDFNIDDGDGCSADCQSDETCGNGVVDAVTGEECDDGNLVDGDGCSSLCENEDPPSCSDDPQPAWVEHGDGTVTQCSTGLMWEMKTDDGSIHDRDKAYTWSTGDSWSFDGTAVTVFLTQLNTEPCFAGHCDWRLPTTAGSSEYPTGQAAELEALLIEPYPCGTNPCTTIPGYTQSSVYWSSSSSAYFPPLHAWGVFFGIGSVGNSTKTNASYVRAVRGGP